MFIGEYHHNVDGKGRLAIPMKFRKKLSGGAVVTRGLDDCLFIFTAQEWKKLSKKTAALPFSRADVRGFQRFLLAGAMEINVDKQGRVMLPEYLRKYAGLAKEAVVAGLDDRIEIWDKASWDKYKEETEKNSKDIAERLGELGV